MAIEIKVGDEVCYYPYTGGRHPSRLKRLVTKVTASGRFYIEGVDFQWSPKEHMMGSGHKWSAHNRNESRKSVVPWDQSIIDAIAHEDKQLKYDAKISKIKYAVANLRYVEYAKIDQLCSLLELDIGD